jgi:transposase
VTEHQLIERECGCGQRTKGTAPPGAEAPVQYGPRIAAVIVYLYAGQFLSKQRTALPLAELFGIPLSSGTVAALTARAAGRLDGFLEHVREQIAASDVAGFDETGFRVEGRLAWVHCARTGKYTLLMVHPRRGRQAIEAMGILPRLRGIRAACRPVGRRGAVRRNAVRCWRLHRPCPHLQRGSTRSGTRGDAAGMTSPNWTRCRGWPDRPRT